MDLSIIIPCHNLNKYILPLLESLKNLIIKKYKVEYIFVLDDCTDDTEKYILEANLNNVSIMTCNVHSCGIARNIGLEQAKGDYIWFIDGDDWLLEYNFIDSLIDTIKRDHLTRIQIAYISNYYREDNPIMVWQYIFSKEFIKNIRFLHIQPDEDFYFLNEICNKERLLGFSNTCLKVTTPIYYYNYRRPGSNTTQFNTTGKIE